MATKTNSQRVIEARKKREEESKNSSSNSYSNSDRVKKLKYEREIGFDTFDSDLANTNTTLSSILGGWQTQETMANTRSAVENMYKRTSGYQNYVSRYQPDAKTNLGELSDYYKSVLDNWDNIAGTYGQYKDADSYTNETAKLKELQAMTKDELASHLQDKDSIAYTTYGGQDITWKSLFDEKDHAERATAKEGAEGWQKYLADTEGKKGTNAGGSFLDILVASTPIYDTTTAGGMLSQVVHDKRQDKSYQNPTDEWTEEEQNIFGTYYLEDPEKAYEYATNVNNQKNIAKENEQKQAVADSATSGFWAGAGHTLGSIASAPLALADYLDDLTSMASGRPILSDGFLSPFEYSQEVQGSIGTKLNEDYGTLSENIPVIGGKGLGDVYGVGTSIAQSALSGYALGGIGTMVSYFGQGASAGIDEALSRGATDEQAMLYGMLVGAGEGISEKIGVDNMFKLGSADTVKGFITNILKQAGSEGIEEGISSIISEVADRFVMQDMSVYENAVRTYMTQGMSEAEAKKQAGKDTFNTIAWDVVAGGLSGGVHGAIQTTVQSGNENRMNKKVGSAIRENETVDDLKNIASDLGGDAYQKYIELLEGGKIKDAQLGKFFNAVESDTLSGYESARANDVMRSVANKANELGDSKNSGIIASAIQKQKAGQKLSSEERTALKSDTAQAILADWESVGHSQTSKGALKRVGQVDSIITPKTAEEKAVVNATKEAKAQAQENQTRVNEMVQAEGREDVSFYSKSMEQAKAEAFNEIYDGKTDLESYADSFELAYTYGKARIGVSEALKNKGVLTEAQALKAYEAGNVGRAIEKQAKVDAINKQYSVKTFIKGKFDDSIIDYTGNAEGKVGWKDLTAKQKNAVNFARAFSEVTGVNISFITSKVVNEETGKRSGENGRYEASTNTIYIDVYAGIDAGVVEDSIVPTISHEVTHWMKAKAPAMYQKMQDYLLETLTLDGKKTLNEMIAEEKARMKQAHPNQKVTDEDAIDELVARGAEDMLANSDKVRKMLAKMSESEQKSFIAKVKVTFENIMNWVNDLLKQYKSNSKEAELLRQYKERMKELSKMWDATLAEAIKTNQSMTQAGITDAEINTVTEKVGVAFDEETESAYPAPQFSERTWTESEYVQNREVAVKALVKAIGVTKADAERYIDNINSIAKMIADDRERLDYEPNIDETASVLKTNKEYKWTVDMSTLCAKRLLFTGTFDAIQKALPNTAFDSDDIVGLRSLMMSRGYEVACGICYVESTRRELGTITADFIERYKLAQKTGKPITKINSKGEEIALRDRDTKKEIYADKNYTPTLAELNTTDIDLVKRDHPEVYSAYLSYMKARGQAIPKLLETRQEYKGEILKHFTKSAVDSRNKAGGLRVQSFSDFEVAHLIDMMQIALDMSRVGLMSQAYTKVPAFAEVFGDTGIKINLSLIAKGSGLDADGNLVFDDVEGINHEEAFRLREKYSKNVGTILVGKSDAHIIKAMADPRIDYIIPFHKSFWKESLYDALGLTGYSDYTETQNEKSIDPDRKIKNFQPSEYWDYSKSGEENAKTYLEMCKADGRIPKFPQFQNYEGYWKLLIDFKMYDNDGVGSPQTTVQPNFNMEASNRILNEYKGGHRSFPVASDVVDKFVADYKKEHPQAQYSDRTAPIEDEDYKSIKKHFGTTNNYNVAGYMLKDGYMLDFSGKHWGDTTSRTRQVDHRDIQEVISDDNNGVDSMVRMISNGNIRLMPEDGGINLAVAPTKNQRTVLRRYIEYFKGEITVDIDAVGGDTVESFRYDRGTSADRIMGDIDNYFKGGRQSDLMRFHTQYSDRSLMYDDGGNAVVIMDKTFSKNKVRNDIVAVEKEVKRVLMALDGTSVVVNDNGKRIYFDGYFADEYTGSNDTMRGNDVNKTAKMNASAVAEEIIINAKYDTWDKNRKTARKANADRGFDYYNVLFAFENTDGSYTKFGGLLNVRKDKNGKDYAYDITKVNKIGSVALYPDIKSVQGNKPNPSLATATDEQASVNTSETTSGTASAGSIAQESTGNQGQFSDRDIDSWLDSLSIDDIIADLQDMFWDDTTETPKKQRTPRRVDEVKKRLDAIGLSFNGTKSLAWTDERIEKYLSGGWYGSSNPNYAQAYIAYVTPQQFLNLTAGAKTSTVDMIENESATYGELDIEKLGNSNPLSLFIEEGKNKAEVTGHEGRHRMYLLGKAGFERIPVLLFDYSTKYDKTAKDSLKLTAQRFNEEDFISKTRDTVISDLVPFSNGNKDLIIQKFGSGVEADIHYSDRDYTSVYELMGEKDTLDEENRKLKADIEKLKATIGSEDVKITRFRSLADYLKKHAGSNYSREALGDALKELYTYIQTTDDLKWYNVMAKAEEIANDMMQLNVPVNYFREVMNDIRQDKVSLSAEQMAEAEKLYGNYGNLHKALFGRVNLTKSGRPLEEQWKDWSKAFPMVFKADISATDMVKELRDIVDALKNTSAVMGEYERQEAIRHVGMEIYNQFWNIASDTSEAVRKERVAHREMMEEMRKNYEKRQAEKTLHPVGEVALKYEKLLKDTIKRDRAEMKRIRELGNKRMEEYKERAEVRATIQKITKNALTLNEWFVKNSKDKHIPEEMKGAVVQLVTAIDFSSKQMLGIGGAQERRNQPTGNDLRLAKALSRLYEVADEMKDNQTEESVFMELDIPDSAVALLKQLSTKSLVLNQMTLEQLQALDVVVSTFKKAIITANKNFVLAQNETRERTSNLLIHDADSLAEKKADNLATNFLEYANTTPYYMLKRLGRVGEQIFNVLMDAQEQLVFLEEEIINFVKKTVDGKKIKQWSEEIHEIKILDGKRSTEDNPKYKTIKMTTAQIMSLYALEKRESAKLHLAGGGIRIANIKDGAFKTIKDAEGSSLARSELYSIIGRLTNEQKRVADALQKYMSETGAEWGNKVTMARWDIKQFGEENYFPMATIAQDKNLDDVGKKDNSIYRLLNMSFTKELTPKANNQLVIDNIFDVFSSHMTDMAKYTTHALPLLDTMKILGYSRKDFYVDEDGKKSVRHDTISVASSIRRAFGDNGYRYIINLLKDLNGVEVTPRDEALTKTMMANYKISAVGGNLRVALLQGSAYIKAGLVMNPKYLTKALATNGLEGSKKAMKHSGIALWKSKGHYDLNIGRSVASEIKQDENWMDTAREWSLKGAEWGDKITWGYLWNACELWARENTPYSYNSAEFNKAVADKLREIIVKTQVVDSTLTRSQMMRGKSAMVQTLTAFMSESTMTYNMVSDAFFEWSLDARKEGHSYKSTFSRHGRKFATTVSVYTLTAFTTALAGAFVDAMRDDDEEKEFDEKYLENLLESLGDNLNLFANLPIAKDIVSIAQGYSPSRFDEQSFVNLFSGMRQWMKVAEGEGNVYKATYKTLQGMSQLTGLPVSNAMRDIVAMWNSTIGEMYPHLKIEQ